MIQEATPEDGDKRFRLMGLAGYFLRLGATGFGGPVALCGLMERDLVELRRWLDAEQMRDIIAVCQTLPGPLAVQVGIFVGYQRCGFWGAWVSGWALILPASLMVAALAAAYVHLHGLPWLAAIIYGVSPAVIALILQSWWRLVRLGMQDRFQYAVAAVGLVGRCGASRPADNSVPRQRGCWARSGMASCPANANRARSCSNSLRPCCLPSWPGSSSSPAHSPLAAVLPWSRSWRRAWCNRGIGSARPTF